MQTITVTDIKKGKEGDSQHGHWIMHNLTFPELKIFEESGKEHKFTKASTFDEAADTLVKGDTIEAEVEITAKGYLNLHKIKKVSGGEIGGADSASKTSVKPPMTPKPASPQETVVDNAYWERKQAIERISIERQVSAKLAFEHGINERDDTAWSVSKALFQAEAIFQWIHLGQSNAPVIKPIEGKNTIIPKEAPKPSESPPGDSQVVTRLLYDTIKTNMKFRGPKSDKTVEDWLGNVAHIDMDRVANEPGELLAELVQRYKWG